MFCGRISDVSNLVPGVAWLAGWCAVCGFFMSTPVAIAKVWEWQKIVSKRDWVAIYRIAPSGPHGQRDAAYTILLNAPSYGTATRADGQDQSDRTSDL